MLIDFGDPRSEHWELMRPETVPPKAMLARRMEALTLGVLGQLEAHRQLAPDRARVAVRRPALAPRSARREEPFHTRRRAPAA